MSAACSINLSEWQRTYFYKWDRRKRGYSKDDIEFYLLAGPYPDVAPGRHWQDVGEVVDMDDRPGIGSILGYYQLPTHNVVIQGGPCS